MRNIKYRFWDKRKKEMIDMILIARIWHLDIFLNPNYETLEYTGLKDKNDKDIYEGDIVENYALRDVVIFDKGIFTTKRSSRDKFGVKQSLAVHDELKVVGNIYKNPELLEKKNGQ